MSEASGVIYRGSKVFWKVRSTVDVIIIRHSTNDILEVVCTDPVHIRECGRLYVNESVLRDRVAENLFLVEQKEHLSKKDPNQDGAMIPSGVELSTHETANFILDRLHVESYDPKSRIFYIEMLEYLPTEEKAHADTDGASLISSRPASLVPFSNGSQPVNDNTSQEIHAALKVDIDPPPASASPTSKSLKANVPRIELAQITQPNSQDTYTSSTAPPPHTGPKNNHDVPKPQQISQHNTAHLHVQTADSLEADFHIYHGRRDQNHRPFAAGALLNSMSNSNPGTARVITSPVISPRTTAASPVLPFTPRKAKKINHSLLQGVHNTQNLQAAEQRHTRQPMQAQHTNASHSVGSTHSQIPLPDQLTKVTTHPTLPPNRKLTPHQEPYVTEPKIKHKKTYKQTFGAQLRSSFSRLFGCGRNRKVYSSSGNSVDEPVVPILNVHNEVLLVKPSEVKRHSSTASTDSTGAAAIAVYNSSIPKHMQVPLQMQTTTPKSALTLAS